MSKVKNIKNTSSRGSFLVFILVPILVLFFFLSAIKTAMYEKTFYHEEFEKTGVYEKYGSELADSSLENVLDYLSGESELSSFFSERDKAHMIDVKNLFDQGLIYYYLSIIAIVLFMSILYILRRDAFNLTISKVFLVSGSVAAFIVVIAATMQNKFLNFFLWFHQTFFNNDLWILDPAKDNLVNLFTEEFFYDITVLIATRVLITSFIMIAVGIGIWYFSKDDMIENKKNKSDKEQV